MPKLHNNFSRKKKKIGAHQKLKKKKKNPEQKMQIKQELKSILLNEKNRRQAAAREMQGEIQTVSKGH